jgi:hypothetical protein
MSKVPIIQTSAPRQLLHASPKAPTVDVLIPAFQQAMPKTIETIASKYWAIALSISKLLKTIMTVSSRLQACPYSIYCIE